MLVWFTEGWLLLAKVTLPKTRFVWARLVLRGHAE